MDIEKLIINTLRLLGVLDICRPERRPTIEDGYLKHAGRYYTSDTPPWLEGVADNGPRRKADSWIAKDSNTFWVRKGRLREIAENYVKSSDGRVTPKSFAVYLIRTQGTASLGGEAAINRVNRFLDGHRKQANNAFFGSLGVPKVGDALKRDVLQWGDAEAALKVRKAPPIDDIIPRAHRHSIVDDYLYIETPDRNIYVYYKSDLTADRAKALLGEEKNVPSVPKPMKMYGKIHYSDLEINHDYKPEENQAMNKIKETFASLKEDGKELLSNASKRQLGRASLELFHNGIFKVLPLRWGWLAKITGRKQKVIDHPLTKLATAASAHTIISTIDPTSKAAVVSKAAVQFALDEAFDKGLDMNKMAKDLLNIDEGAIAKLAEQIEAAKDK